jgi:hypothetical protein
MAHLDTPPAHRAMQLAQSRLLHDQIKVHRIALARDRPVG